MNLRAVKLLVTALLISMFISPQILEAKINSKTMRQTKAPKNTIWLDSLAGDSDEIMGLGAGKAYFAGPILLKGTIYRHGIGAFPSSALAIELNGSAVRFLADVGVNDLHLGKEGTVNFEVWVDEKKAAESGEMIVGADPEFLSVDLKGAKRMFLIVRGKGGTNIATEWGGALIALDPKATARPEIIRFEDEPPIPIAHTDLDEVGIHGPRIVGTTPGNPFLFLIPATGEKPLSFKAEGLPDGLELDSETGIISGSLKEDGKTVVTLIVTAKNGAATRKLAIIGGKHRLALTPPMGWNSWNAWGTAVDEEKVRSAAESMVKSGLAAHGYQFVNIDDAWEAGRADDGEILTNEKFPDMKKLGDDVHAMGLRLGIYSSPGPLTCAGYEGSYNHEFQDAATYAKWGIDYLKYDWCGYRNIATDSTRETLMKPYLHMREALDASGRDIVYSLCQYGMGKVWEWGAETGGNLWRTTGDIVDTWASMTGIGFGQNGLDKHAKPGHWNDPDMLVVGKVGWGPNLHPTRLTKNEQITHITLWSILASPLLIGCDMADMDEFTVNVLTNTEVIDVNQDPLGRQGAKVAEQGFLLEVWARPLYDGTMAVALFNRFIEGADITVNWADISMEGTQLVRDLWQKKDLGEYDSSFTAKVPAHGAIMLKIGKSSSGD